MTIIEAYEALKAIDPTTESISERQTYPPFEDASSFQYWFYNADRAVFSWESWEDLIEKVQKEVASAYL